MSNAAKSRATNVKSQDHCVVTVVFARSMKQVDYHLNREQSKTGLRIAKIRNRKARSQRRSRLKHHGETSAAISSSHGKKQAKPAQRSERIQPQGYDLGDDSASASASDSDSNFDSYPRDNHNDHDGGD